MTKTNKTMVGSALFKFYATGENGKKSDEYIVYTQVTSERENEKADYKDSVIVETQESACYTADGKFLDKFVTNIVCEQGLVEETKALDVKELMDSAAYDVIDELEIFDDEEDFEAHITPIQVID